jgi:hypothetical protein
VAISFGSPASESGVTRLDLNQILVRHPQAAFLMRIAGDSMREAGVDDGDLALVDRALTAAHGQVVIAIVDDEFVCRRLHRRGTEVRLQGRPGLRRLGARRRRRTADLGRGHARRQAARDIGGRNMFALVDVNNMYVSCERVFRPSLNGGPWSCCPTTTAPASPAATRPRTWACAWPSPGSRCATCSGRPAWWRCRPTSSCMATCPAA